MGRGERWRAMSGKVTDALHCITKCCNICFRRPIMGGCDWIPQGLFILSSNVPKLKFTSCKFDIR